MKILFVCRANVGRSQMAEALLKSFEGKYEVLSAGTNVIGKDGESREGQSLSDLPAAENVILSLRERGIEVSESRRMQINPSLVDWADKIVVMAEKETVPNYLSSSPKVVYWQVSDPKGTSLEEHRRTLRQIEGLIKDLIETK